MRIGIEINGVLRDTLKKIQQEYEKWYLNENWKEMEFIENEKDIDRKVISDVTSLDLKKHLEFKNEDEIYDFLYKEHTMEIFGHASSVEYNSVNDLNDFYVDMRDNHEIIIVSDEIGKSKPASLFFLSKFGCQLEKVKFYIDIAADEGGVILFGGNKVVVEGSEHGYYLQPTVIEVADNKCKLNQEEIFGPVVTIMPFNSDAEALHLANESRYGLSATLWTNNLNRTLQFSKELQTGIVWVNSWMLRDLRTPFGGQKDSGVGREGGFEALRFFTEPKNICIQYE